MFLFSFFVCSSVCLYLFIFLIMRADTKIILCHVWPRCELDEHNNICRFHNESNNCAMQNVSHKTSRQKNHEIVL